MKFGDCGIGCAVQRRVPNRFRALRRSRGRRIALGFFELPLDFANVFGIERASHFAERTSRFVELQSASREINADDAHT